LYERMKANGVHPRKYFYPLISEFPMYRGLPSSHSSHLPVARQAAAEVLCLPIYPDLAREELQEIIDIINDPS